MLWPLKGLSRTLSMMLSGQTAALLRQSWLSVTYIGNHTLEIRNSIHPRVSQRTTVDFQFCCSQPLQGM